MVYQHIKLRQDDSIHGWNITIYGLEKQTSEIHLPVSTSTTSRNWHVVLHQPAKCHSNRVICGRAMTSYRFWIWPPPRLNTTSGFVFVDVTVFRRSKSIREPNLIDVTQFAADVYLLPSVKNQRPQYCSALPVITLYRRYNVITGSAEQSRPRRLWRSFDELLDRGRAHLSSDIDASTLHRFFDDKVDGVRASTAGADSPTFTTTPVRFWCNLAVWWSMPSMVMWSNSKPEVEFQYGGRFVFRNRK